MTRLAAAQRAARAATTHNKGITMGAWGIGVFENDDAMDWVCDLRESDADEGLVMLQEIFSGTLSEAEDYLESPVTCMALAAGETCAALNGHPMVGLNEDVQHWVEGKPKPDADTIALGIKAVSAGLAENSEARELWEEAGEYETWKATVDDLLTRLSAGS